MTTPTSYVGDELEVFALAKNWKRYWGRFIRPLARGRVLEVGAGLGTSTRIARGPAATAWTCLEPDPDLAARIRRDHQLAPRPVEPIVRVGTIESLEPAETFDSILYIDVLEHIRGDAEELARAAAHLAPGGALIVLAPAHPEFFSTFDRRIGHFRRYNAASLRALSPPGLAVERIRYLDSAGMLLSWLNRHVRRGGTPGPAAILAWDRLFIPVSRLIDPILRYRHGKTVVAVWRAPVTPRALGDTADGPPATG